ncbi:MAG TPA: hypothetical protein VE547_01530, partial [Mycobacteriales bacterium]|nr:hypothetical protein [Mycobacteriales bacterium]
MSRALLAALVDDAALFPPGNAPMRAALAGHREHRRGPHAELVGRFLCPASRLGELQAELRAGPGDAAAFRLGLIADGTVPALLTAVELARADPGIELEAVELRLPADFSELADLPTDLLSFIEVPRDRLDALDLLAGTGHAAKLRTGGPTADAFPSVAEVAAFLAACTDRDLPYKCTAGLHAAVRHPPYHGFLNVLLGAHAAATGGDVHSALSEPDGRTLAKAAAAIDDAQARATRARFAGYGS